MKRFSVFLAVTASLLATPLLAGQPAKRPTCQVTKAPARDVKRPEPCRKPTIPPVVDPTPFYLVSTGSPRVTLSDLS